VSEKLRNPKCEEFEQTSDLENEDSVKSDDCEMEDLESRVKNMTLDDNATNGANETDLEDSDALCGGLFDEEEESSRCPSPIPSSSLSVVSN